MMKTMRGGRSQSKAYRTQSRSSWAHVRRKFFDVQMLRIEGRDIDHRLVWRMPNRVIHGDHVVATRQYQHFTEVEHPTVQHIAARLLRLTLSIRKALVRYRPRLRCVTCSDHWIVADRPRDVLDTAEDFFEPDHDCRARFHPDADRLTTSTT
jgi:hypothetical protein